MLIIWGQIKEQRYDFMGRVGMGIDQVSFLILMSSTLCEFRPWSHIGQLNDLKAAVLQLKQTLDW